MSLCSILCPKRRTQVQFPTIPVDLVDFHPFPDMFTTHMNRPFPEIVVWVGILLLSFSGIACNEKSSSSDQSSSKSPSVVRVGYFANLTHAQAILGLASGELEQALAPTKLEQRVFNAGPALIEALNAGEIDLAYVGPGPVISAHVRSRGQSIRVISGSAKNGVVLVATEASGIRNLTDMKGKRLATPQAGNTQDISARHFLQQAIGDVSNVVPVPNTEQRNMMERGQIDAAWVPEPWGALLIAQTGARLVLEEKDLWPDKQFVLTLVTTTPKFLEKYPETVKKFLRVHHQWTQRLDRNPSAYISQLSEALFKLTQKSLPPEVLEQAISRVSFTDEPLVESLQAMNQWAYDLGFSRQTGSLEGLIDTTILDQVRHEETR